MTSDQIKDEPMPPTGNVEFFYVQKWLQEIAYQLAVLNDSSDRNLKTKVLDKYAEHCITENATLETATLRKRVDELLNANNAEVEARRTAQADRDHSREMLHVAVRLKLEAQGKLEAAEQHIKILNEDILRLRESDLEHWQRMYRLAKSETSADPQQGKRDAVSERGERVQIRNRYSGQLAHVDREWWEQYKRLGADPVWSSVASTNQPSPTAVPADTSTATETGSQRPEGYPSDWRAEEI